MINIKMTTRQYLMLGIIIVFVMTLIIGNYGVYTYINHQRYIVKEALMDDIEANVAILGRDLQKEEEAQKLFKSLYEKQLIGQGKHSIIENYHMSVMTYDDNLERTYNPEVTSDGVGMLMIYQDHLKNMPTDLRVECNMLFDGYNETQFLHEAMVANHKLVLSSSFGYTSVLPYDKGIDGNERQALVTYYEQFHNLDTSALDKWSMTTIPGDERTYIKRTSSLESGNDNRYLLTSFVPLQGIETTLHGYEKTYDFYVMDGQGQLLIDDFKSAEQIDGQWPTFDEISQRFELSPDQLFPFVEKSKNDYLVGYPVRNSDWTAYAVFNEKSIGKNTLFKTSGFYFLNMLFIGIFSFLVVVVNRHLTEQEK